MPARFLRRYREAVATLTREYAAVVLRDREDIERYFDSTGGIRESYALYRRCNVCGGTATRGFLAANPYTYVQCVGCGFRYMNPMVDPAKTDILSQGISTIRETVARDPGMDRQMRRRTRQVREVLGLGRSGALLDIGCGLGRHLFQLKDHFARAEGVELCATSVQFCRERRLTVYDVPLEEARLPESSYDVVMMSQVLEHLPDPRGTCREIRRLLRPDGYLYLDTPNFASLSMRLFRSRNAVVLGSSHVSLFDVGSLRNLLASLGFEVVSAKTYQTDLFPVDVACYLWGRSAFRHRRNLRFPLYLLWYRAFHVVFEEHVFTNLGAQWGAYLRAVARRSRD